MIRSALLNVMMNAARKAAKGLTRDFGEVENLQVSMKGPGDFVSAADRRAEKILMAELTKARPDYGLNMEESGIVQGKDKSHVWVVDPIDGTTNFLHGIPHFALSIGLVRDGEAVAGVIYNPITDEMFHAEKGSGAFVNERRLRVSSRRKLQDAIIATGIPHLGRPDHEGFVKELQALMGSVAGVRRMGSASLDLAYVAAARYDGYWERNLKPWDIAAGIIMVREAGGTVRDIDSEGSALATGNILAANDFLSQPLAKALAQAKG